MEINDKHSLPLTGTESHTHQMYCGPDICLCMIRSALFFLILWIFFELFLFVNILLEVQTYKEMAIVFQWSQPAEARGTLLRIIANEDAPFRFKICVKQAIQ